MKTTLKIIATILLFIAFMFGSIYVLGKCLNTLSDSAALIGKCTRVTGKTFFECQNMMVEELKTI